MQAVRIQQWGQPPQVEDLPQPVPSNDEILVRVRAASITPLDCAVAAGYLQGMLRLPMPLGTDYAGDVISVGADVKHVKPGDAVYGFIALRSGTFSEYAVPKANEVALKPKSLDYVQAAAAPLAVLVAWQMLVNVLHLKQGERLFIQGASGDVGSAAIQIAKGLGAYVIGTGSSGKADYSKSLGIDEYISYEEQHFEDAVHDVDAVLDLVGGEALERSFQVLKRGGRLVTILNQQITEGKAEQYGVQATASYAIANAEELAKLAEMIDAGKLKVRVSHTLPLAEVQTALDTKLQGKTNGRIILTVD